MDRIRFQFPIQQPASTDDEKSHAQLSLRYFTQCVSNPRQSMSHFAVRIKTQTNQLHVNDCYWIDDVKLIGNEVQGRVNSPGIPYHDHLVTCPMEMIVDWMFIRNYRLIGAYSLRYLLTSLPTRFATYSLRYLLTSAASGGYSCKKFCVSVDESERTGAVFDFFDAIGDHNTAKVKEMCEDSSLVEALCEVATNWNWTGAEMETLHPLQYAVECQNEEAAEVLIANGADGSRGTQCRGPAIHTAVRYELRRTITSIIESGVDVNLEHNKLPRTPLMVAAQNNSTALCEFLVSRGADVDHLSERLDSTGRVVFRRTPMHYASSKAAAQLFHERCATPDVIDEKGKTALHHAIFNQYFDTAIYLSSVGYSLHLKDFSGISPLDIAKETKAWKSRLGELGG